MGADALDLFRRQVEGAVLDVAPLRFDQFGQFPGAHLVHQDLDARLVQVVPPPELVIDAHDRFQIGQQVFLGQELADRRADERGAPLAAADDDLETGLAGVPAAHDEADVVQAHRRAVVGRAGDRDLELARQEREFGVQGRPLADDLAVDARVLDLVGGDAGVLVGGGVAEAVAAGLDGVHLDPRQLGQDVGRVLQPGPVVLDVLARGEMAVAPVVAPGDMGELAHLHRRQQAVGDRHPQHVGMELQIEPVHEAERLELVLRQLPGKPARDLAAELPDPLVDQGLVVFVVAVHGPGYPPAACWPNAGWIGGPWARISSR